MTLPSNRSMSTSRKKVESGTTIFNFVDSYKFNIAAYTLSEMLGIDDMLPVYVERKWQGRWVAQLVASGENGRGGSRRRKKSMPPNQEAWNKQMYRVRVFDELIYDTDANLTNVLIGADWQVWRIDFTRAFRTSQDLQHPRTWQCERHLCEKLKELNASELEEKTQNYLTKEEVDALMARTGQNFAALRPLIKEKGEEQVLY